MGCDWSLLRATLKLTFNTFQEFFQLSHKASSVEFLNWKYLSFMSRPAMAIQKSSSAHTELLQGGNFNFFSLTFPSVKWPEKSTAAWMLGVGREFEKSRKWKWLASHFSHTFPAVGWQEGEAKFNRKLIFSEQVSGGLKWGDGKLFKFSKNKFPNIISVGVLSHCELLLFAVSRHSSESQTFSRALEWGGTSSSVCKLENIYFILAKIKLN